jgi:hypothetical protein
MGPHRYRAPERSHATKALGIQPRTLELLDRLWIGARRATLLSLRRLQAARRSPCCRSTRATR